MEPDAIGGAAVESEAEPEDPEPSRTAEGAAGSARPGLSASTRRRLAEVFGEVLPATTSDERDDRDRAADRTADDDLLADRPPHHDRDQ